MHIISYSWIQPKIVFTNKLNGIFFLIDLMWILPSTENKKCKKFYFAVGLIQYIWTFFFQSICLWVICQFYFLGRITNKSRPIQHSRHFFCGWRVQIHSLFLQMSVHDRKMNCLNEHWTHFIWVKCSKILWCYQHP